MLSKPLKVIVYIRIALRSAFKRFAQKDAALKTEAFFAYVISGERRANGPKKVRNDAFHVKKKRTSQSAKNKLNPAKSENQPKNRYTPFLHEGLQFYYH